MKDTMNDANEALTAIAGEVENFLHIDFEDSSRFAQPEKMSGKFHRIRNKACSEFFEFYNDNIK